jgi:glycosyltransferase involved in cell wall biosynthesis
MTSVSVIVPSNGSPYLEQALESVFDQGRDDLEVIVVLNGVSQRPEVVDRLPVNLVESRDPLFPEVARALGVRHSSGEVLAFLDHDDIWLPGKLKQQLPSLDSPDVVMSHSQYILRDESTGADSPGVARPLDYLSLLAGHLAIFSSGVLMSRDAYDRAGGFRETGMIGEDLDLYLRVLCLGRGAFVEHPLFIYRRHMANASGTWRTSMHGARTVYRRHWRAASRRGDYAAMRAARQGLRAIRPVYAHGAHADLLDAYAARNPWKALRAIASYAALSLPEPGWIATRGPET